MIFSDDLPADNTTLRRRIYSGALYKLPATPESLDIAGYMRQRVTETLGSPVENAPARMGTPEFLERMRDLRAVLVEEETCKEYVRGLMRRYGFDPAENAFDVMRLRGVTSGGHENASAARAYALHRDTWYANPQSQINWWFALQDTPEERTFSFYPDYFNMPVANSSTQFDYDVWMEKVGWQGARGKHASVEYPYAVLPEDAKRMGFECRVGEIILFSAAHLHGTNPNNTGICRYSVDFRSVHLADHAAGLGAPNADNGSRPDVLRDYVRSEKLR